MGRAILKYLVALGAGFMLAAIFIEILPETIGTFGRRRPTDSRSQRPCLPAMTLCYWLVICRSSSLSTHCAALSLRRRNAPESLMRPSAAYTAVGGLWIHTFFDGVSIASAFLSTSKSGCWCFIAILLHKMPEGFTVASIMLAAGRSGPNGSDGDCRHWRCNSCWRDRSCLDPARG